ncbi:MAG: hypothetical protein IPP72_16385 [Chitinophagaceae bacterium]|nr:hypothetical protein [Chitinophagaceae bacterium]
MKFYKLPDGYTSTSHVTANFHYLANELTSSVGPYHVNSEPIMVTMDCDNSGGFAIPDEHGRSSYDLPISSSGFQYTSQLFYQYSRPCLENDFPIKGF